MSKSLLTVLFLLPLSACISDVGSGNAATESRDAEGATAFHLENFVAATVRQADGPASMDLTCDDNLLDLFETEVEDGVLVLRTRRAHNLLPKATCEAFVSLPVLNGVAASGSGGLTVQGDVDALHTIEVSGSGGLEALGNLGDVQDIRTTGSGGLALGSVQGCSVEVDATGSGGLKVVDIQACDLSVVHSGSGRVRLDGVAESLDLDQSGSGGFGETGLEVASATLRVSGSGGAELTVLESVEVTVSGSGGVTIHGNPAQRDVNDTGSGGVKFQD
jgi:hypothetical protein